MIVARGHCGYRLAMLNDRSTPLDLLLTRRSGKARDIVEPGPDATQIGQIITAASRVPDHGKLAPWRFVLIPQTQRDALAAVITTAYGAERPEAGSVELAAMDGFPRHAPCLIALLSTPDMTSKIPLWEQQLSAGAAAMALLDAAHALGFVGNWLTGWPAYNPAVASALGCAAAQDRIVGFFFIGTAAKPLDDRPRPDHAEIFHVWDGNSRK